jgi:hypothetical protein
MGPRITGFLYGAIAAGVATQLMVYYDVLCKLDAVGENLGRVKARGEELFDSLDTTEKYVVKAEQKLPSQKPVQ